MDVIEQQFADLEVRFPATKRRGLANGTSLLEIPNFSLPDGWNKTQTTVAFIVPAGYPYARPDCFWADLDLRLSSGAMPANSGTNPGTGGAQPMLWFSFHPTYWNPNTDSLITYTNVIRARFAERR